MGKETYEFKDLRIPVGFGDLDDLYEDLVEGDKEPTVAGEIVRAIVHLCTRWNFHGEKPGTGIGLETCTPAAQLLIEKLDATTGYVVWRLNYDAWTLDDNDYADRLCKALCAILAFLQVHPELKKAPDQVHTYKGTEEEDE